MDKKAILKLQEKLRLVREGGMQAMVLNEVMNKITVMKGDKGDSPTREELLNIIRPLIPDPIPGQNGKDADEVKITEKVIREVSKKIPTIDQIIDEIIPFLPEPIHGEDGKDGKDGSPDTPEDIVKKVNQSKEKIDASQIKNLPTIVESRALPSISLFGGGGGGQVKDIEAGSNVTVTKRDSGVYTISSTGGGGGTWGSITGTLSDQTDLQTALNGKLSTSATTADISDSTNKRYVTDAYLTVLSNTSGTNTGDNATNSQYSGLATSKQDTLVSGTNIKTINGSSLLGSGDITISSSVDWGDIGGTLSDQTDLQAALDAKFTLPSLTAGSVLFSNGTTIAQDNANFFWDDTNNRLGIGTTSPGSKLSVSGSAAQIAEFVSSNSGSSYFLLQDGSATPVQSYYGIFGGGLSFQSRLNTGAAYPIRFVNGNTESVRINTSGNVGIGTTSPVALLHISGANASTLEALRVTNTNGSGVTGFLNIGTSGWVLGAATGSGSSNQAFQITTAAGASSLVLAASRVTFGSSDGIIGANGADFLIKSEGSGAAGYSIKLQGYNGSTWQTVVQLPNKASGNVDLHLVPSGGNVGIGTTAPGYMLHIYKSDSTAADAAFPQMMVENPSTASTAYAVIKTKVGTGYAGGYPELWLQSKGGTSGENTIRGVSNHDLVFKANDTEWMRVLKTGNVGIGTASPAAKLDVSGAILGQRLVEANTAGSGSPNIITSGESRTLYTNEGATALNYHTLPTAAAGLTYTFYVQDADGIRVTANTGDVIKINGVASSTAGYCESTSIGSSITLTAINATDWVATSVIGVWSLA